MQTRDKNSEYKAIFIYGPAAVGKFTVANLICEKIGYKLIHNHSLIDAVKVIFDRGTENYSKIIHNLRMEFFHQVASVGANVVITHCYSNNYINTAVGMSDPEYVLAVKKIFEDAGIEISFVHLKADEEALSHRVVSESRKGKKLCEVDDLKEFMKDNDFETSAPIEGQLVIDSSKLEANEVADTIIKHFSLDN